MSRFKAIRDVLTRASTWFAVIAAVSALYAAFGAKPKANWQIIKAADQATTLPSNDVDKAPDDAVVYKGLPVDEVKQRELAEKIASALAVLFTILAAFTGQREDPPPPPPSSPFSGGGGGRMPQLALLIGCSIAFAGPLAGCAALTGPQAQVAPGNDPLVVNAERTIQIAFETVDAFLAAEHDNRAAIARDLPTVHAAAEQLRRDAPAAFAEAKEAVRLYKGSRTAEVGDAMDVKIARVQSLARTARQYLLRIESR